jgi:MFS family permease
LVPEANTESAGIAKERGGAWRALRDNNFRLYFAGQLCAQIGTWTQRVAQAWLVLELTGSAAALGSVVALQFVPLLVLSVFAGAVADRLPKQRVLIASYAAEFTVSLTIAVLALSGRIEVLHVYALAFVFGLANAFERPALQALIGLIVRREDLQSALGLDMTLFGGARIVSTTVAGLVIATSGIGWCFLIAALAFLPMIASLTRIRVRSGSAKPSVVMLSVGADLVAGLSYVRSAPALVFPMVSLTFLGLFGYNLSVTLPLLAHDALAVGSVGFGAMQSAMGVGGLLGAVAVASSRSPTPRTLVLAGLGFGGLLIAVSTSSSLALTLVLLVCVGASSIVYLTNSNAFLQWRTVSEFRGRVMGLYVLLVTGVTPIGAWITGAFAETWGIRPVLGLEGAACVLGALAVSCITGATAGSSRRSLSSHASHDNVTGLFRESSVALVSQCLAAIAERDQHLHSFVSLDPERAIAEARKLDAQPNLLGPLHGIPIAVKDLFDVAEVPTRCELPIHILRSRYHGCQRSWPNFAITVR